MALIIGASSDNFSSLRGKIEKFINEEGKSKNQAARLWQINNGLQWRLEQILLPPELQEKWDTINDEEILNSRCWHCVLLPCLQSAPVKKVETEEKYFKRLQNWRERRTRQDEERDSMAAKRQLEFEGLFHPIMEIC